MAKAAKTKTDPTDMVLQGPALLAATDAAAAAFAHPPLQLRHDQIIPDPDNARRDFDADELASLADTLYTRGLQQPCRALPANLLGQHQLIMGERRWRAWGLLVESGRWTADHAELVLIEEADELARLEAGLIENLQRVNLNHMEAGLGFEKLAARCGRSNKQIAAALGRTPEFVQQHRRLANLTEADQDRVRSGDLPLQDALKILARPKAHVPSPGELLVLAEVADALLAKHGNIRGWTSIQCQPTAAGAELDCWVKAGLITFSVRHYHNFTSTIETGWDTGRQICAVLPEFAADDVPPAVADLLDRLRTEVHGAIEADACRAEGRYATAWLNGPFVIAAEDQAQLDARAARAKEEKDKADVAKARLAEVRGEVKALGAQVRKGLAGASELQAAVDKTGVKLPLSMKGSDIVDATGKMIASRGYCYSSSGLSDENREVMLRLLVLAANSAMAFGKTPAAAADVAAPEDPADVEASAPDPAKPAGKANGVRGLVGDEFSRQIRKVVAGRGTEDDVELEAAE